MLLDADLAMLYGVETGALNRAVKRNLDRFLDDFMFQLSSEDWENLKCRIGISSAIGRFPPKANFKDIVGRTPTPKNAEAFKFDEAARKNIPIAEISEDAWAVLDCGIFCLPHWASKVGTGRKATRGVCGTLPASVRR